MRLAITLLNIVSRIILVVPRNTQIVFGNVLGLFWFYVVPIRRAVAIENISLAFPEWPRSKVRSLALKNFQNYALGFLELLMIPGFNRAVFEKLVVVEGWTHYEKARSQAQGVFLLTLHLGSWELMSACQAHLGIPLHVITKKFKAGSLNQAWVDLRVGHGIKLIAEEKTTFQILRAIRQNEVVGFILDQFMGPPVGVRTKFFGRETGTAASLALFVDRTRAPVVPVYNVRDPNGKIRIVFEPPIEFVEQGGTEQNISFMTQVYTSKIEEVVRRYPDQWLWIHRRWKPFRT
ncbi:MAG: lysophospholipid acyltransferase family protein [Oligoflexia bacterium]|nr:lysophospholipid acyltransferase family protein [Oligoflexia bacterium]